MKDLILLVADKDAEQTLKALLGERQQSLGIHLIQYDIIIHPERDGGVRSRCVEFLRPYTSVYRYATVLRAGTNREFTRMHRPCLPEARSQTEAVVSR